jgi:hypothetical protein
MVLMLAHRVDDAGLTRMDPQRCQLSAKLCLDEVRAVKQPMEGMLISLHANS